MTADHWCVAFAGEAELGTSAAGLLSEGLARGEQVGYFGWGGVDELRGRLHGLGVTDEIVERGVARFASLDEDFRRDEPPEPDRLMGFWSDATRAALDAGFSALRVVADTTPWADLDPEQRKVFLRGEQLIDRYRLDHPLTLVCACDASTLQPDALVETACIHPSSEGVSPPFRLHATERADFALHGEIDAYAAPFLERVLDAARPLGGNREVVIDAADLGFIEHRSLWTLERHAERVGVTAVVLRTASRTTGDLVKLLDLHRVRVEAPR